jgi:aminocarboxymuconate-semialdehyde decarboxylase
MSELMAGPVDVHSHVTPAHFPADRRDEARWPCMCYKAPDQATITFGTKPFRKLDLRSWDIERRLEDLDRHGLAAQVLSPMPELLSYWFAPPAAAALCDHVNAEIAGQVAVAPRRLAGLGMVPMQDPDLAIRHLERIKHDFGLAGVEVGSNINGAYLGEVRFAPIFEAAAELGLAVFVHALHPVATRDSTISPAFSAMAGFPLDVGATAASLLMAGTLDRYPGLRIGFSHGGGALPSILARLEHSCARGMVALAGASTPVEMAARMFFDSNVYSARHLRYLIEAVAPGQFFLGTDYPYPIMENDPVALAAAAGLESAAHQSLLEGAARRFLGQR